MIVSDIGILRNKCKDVSIIESKNIIEKLELELKNSDVPGIGLAANQIGIDKRICIIRINDVKLDLVNPEIIEQYDLMEFENEGCLSFRNEYILTKRFNEIFIRDDLHSAGIVLTGLEAVVAQHEVGHLYGKVMYDYEITRPRVSDKCWCGSERKYKKCHMGKIIK